MLRQLSAMVAKMGDLVGAADSGSVGGGNDGDGDGDGSSSASSSSRPVVRAVAKNASDLIGVLCSESNAPLFLRYENEDGTEGGATAAASAAAAAGDEAAIQPEEDAAAAAAAKPSPPPSAVKADDVGGPLAALLTSCAVSLPTQTPSHAALTLGVDGCAPAPYGGFAAR